MKPRRSSIKHLRALTLAIEVLVITQSLTLFSNATDDIVGDTIAVTGVGSFGAGVDLGSSNQVSIDWDATATTNIFDINPSQGAFLWRDLKSSAPTVMRNKMTLDANNSLTLYDSLGGTAHSIILNGNTGKINLRGAGSGINLITSYTNGIPNTTSVFTLDSAGNLAIASSTASTSSSDGALTVLGGMGVAKDSYFNGVRVGRGAGNISSNTVHGYNALQYNTTGYQNTATGYYSLQRNTTGSLNTATGAYSLLGNTTGSLNTATGAYSLLGNTTGNQNTASGWGALQYNTTGSLNTATGYNSLSANSTGYNNTSSGADSLRYNTTGSSNTASGASSLRYNTTGSSNTAYGTGSSRLNSTGQRNTSLGYDAGASNSSGNDNVYVGYNAGRSLPSRLPLVPSNSIYIGSNTYGQDVNESNSIVIGYNAVGEGANTTVIGNSSTRMTHIYGTLNASTLNASTLKVNNMPVMTSCSPYSSLANGALMSIGYGTNASGYESIALGNGPTTTGGGNSSATGDMSFAATGGIASGFNSLAFMSGYASGTASIAMGGYSYCWDESGWGTYASQKNVSLGPNSVTLGGSGNVAYGSNSYAMGNKVTSADDYSFVIGSQNLSRRTQDLYFDPSSMNSSPPASTGWVENTPLFELGNGNPNLGNGQQINVNDWENNIYNYYVNPIDLSNAITVLKNGQTTLTNKAWKAHSTTPLAVPVDITSPPEAVAAAVAAVSGGEALVVEGHTRLKGKVTIEQPQGDISMGIYGD